MIDKLDLRIPRATEFSREFGRLYPELKAMERGPFHAAPHYEYAGDLSAFGYAMRLNLFCSKDKIGNHKIELFDVGQKTRREIETEITSVFDVEPAKLEIMRIDFAVDVPNVPVRWFHRAARVVRKRLHGDIGITDLRIAVGRADKQTLYFGKRPNVIRIYDKRTEYDHQFRNAIRKLTKDIEEPTFEGVMGFSYPPGELTRIERQYGGRIPKELAKFGNVCDPQFSYQPFDPLVLLQCPMDLPDDDELTFETRCTASYLREVQARDGLPGVQAFMKRHCPRNQRWVWDKYSRHLASALEGAGIDTATLHERFRASLAAQMGYARNV